MNEGYQAYKSSPTQGLSASCRFEAPGTPNSRKQVIVLNYMMYTIGSSAFPPEILIHGPDLPVFAIRLGKKNVAPIQRGTHSDVGVFGPPPHAWQCTFDFPLKHWRFNALGPEYLHLYTGREDSSRFASRPPDSIRGEIVDDYILV